MPNKDFFVKGNFLTDNCAKSKKYECIDPRVFPFLKSCKHESYQLSLLLTYFLFSFREKYNILIHNGYFRTERPKNPHLFFQLVLGNSGFQRGMDSLVNLNELSHWYCRLSEGWVNFWAIKVSARDSLHLSLIKII